MDRLNQNISPYSPDREESAFAEFQNLLRNSRETFEVELQEIFKRHPETHFKQFFEALSSATQLQGASLIDSLEKYLSSMRPDYTQKIEAAIKAGGEVPKFKISFGDWISLELGFKESSYYKLELKLSIPYRANERLDSERVARYTLKTGHGHLFLTEEPDYAAKKLLPVTRSLGRLQIALPHYSLEELEKLYQPYHVQRVYLVAATGFIQFKELADKSGGKPTRHMCYHTLEIGGPGLAEKLATANEFLKLSNGGRQSSDLLDNLAYRGVLTTCQELVGVDKIPGVTPESFFDMMSNSKEGEWITLGSNDYPTLNDQKVYIFIRRRPEESIHIAAPSLLGSQIDKPISGMVCKAANGMPDYSTHDYAEFIDNNRSELRVPDGWSRIS